MHGIVRFGLGAIAAVALALGLFWLGRSSAPGPAGSRSATAEESVPIVTSVRPRPAGAPPAAAVSTTTTIAIPEAYALLPGLRLALADSWEELLSGLDPEQRALAEAFASRYPEAYRFASAEQLAWMVERGYPMPEEIAIAEAMPMGELLQLASSGNVKAMMLAVDRGARENETGAPDPDDRERNAELARLSDLQHRMRESCSPFAAYAGARLLQSLSRDDPGIHLLANLGFAQARGDWRVDATIAELARALSLPPEALAALSLVHGSYADVLIDRCRGLPLPQPGG